MKHLRHSHVGRSCPSAKPGQVTIVIEPGVQLLDQSIIHSIHTRASIPCTRRRSTSKEISHLGVFILTSPVIDTKPEMLDRHLRVERSPQEGAPGRSESAMSAFATQHANFRGWSIHVQPWKNPGWFSVLDAVHLLPGRGTQRCCFQVMSTCMHGRVQHWVAA